MSEQFITKRCSHCKEEKLLNEFGKNRSTRDGLQHYCKPCACEAAKKYANSPKGRASKRRYLESKTTKAYFKQYARSSKGKVVAVRYRQSKKGQASVQRYRRSVKCKAVCRKYSQSTKGRENSSRGSTNYKRKYPFRVMAGNTVRHAVANGSLPAPATQVCRVCGQKAKDYHHESYEPDRRLDVIALCHQCHINIHKNHGSVPELSK